MKKLFAVCLIICVIFSMTSVFAFDVTGTVIADVLNVRSQAYVGDGNVIGSLTYGEIVKIVGIENDWYQIEFWGTTAYVKGDYILINENTWETETETLPSYTPAPAATSQGQAVVDYAKTFLGIPYVYGGASPSGFDCSGLVYYVYKQFGQNLYRVANDQRLNGIVVDRSELAPGDIILFARDGVYINHVGLYVGDGNFIHAPQTGRNVEITTMTSGYYNNCYFGARRIFY